MVENLMAMRCSLQGKSSIPKAQSNVIKSKIQFGFLV